MLLQSHAIPAGVGPGSYCDLSGTRNGWTGLTRLVMAAMTGLLLAGCTGGISGSSTGNASGAQSPAQYAVSVSVSGLTGVGLVLQNNGGDDLPVSSDGNFTFKTKLVTGNSYSVTVYNQPDGPPQTCVPQNASGIVSDGDVTGVALVCANKTTSTDLVGGTVSGLQGSGLVLQINGGESVTIQSNGSFTFPTPLPNGASYVVSVVSAPNVPYENCTATNASGTTGDTDVANVSVRCSTSSSDVAYTIGGTVQWASGSGSVVLTDNGLDSVTVASHGTNRPVSFTFGLSIPSGDSYNVTLRSSNTSRSQSCTFTNASGVVQDSDITNIAVVCNASPAPNVTSLQVSPAEPNLALGSSVQFAATATYADGSSADVTSQATWASSNTAAATINSTGFVTSVGLGQTRITATIGALSATTTLTVTNPPSATLRSIQVTPSNPTINAPATQQFTATGVYSDGTTQVLTTGVTWTSSKAGVATISGSGLATPVAAGQTTITATVGTIAGSATLTVNPTLQSIRVTPSNPTVNAPATQQFTATGVYSDGTTQVLTTGVTWTSSKAGVATISASGLATSVAAGQTVITATVGTIAGSATLTVNRTLQSIQVAPSNPTINAPATQQFTATGVYSDGTTQPLTTGVTWTSSKAGVATISASGLATSVAAGQTTITATVGAIAGSTTLTVAKPTLKSIEVTPTNPSIAKGTGEQFTATGVYSDNTTQDLTNQVTWSSSQTAVATISSTGFASSVGVGQTTITATVVLGGGISVVAISGKTTLSVTPVTLQRIEVTPPNPSIVNRTKQQFTATGVFSDNTTQDLTATATWSSNNTNVATISSSGIATAMSVGSAVISATFTDATTGKAITGATTLTVKPGTLQSIEVTPADPTIATGQTQKFTATGIYSDMTTQDLTTQATWSSTNAGVATVGDTGATKGVATAVQAGSTTIMAAFAGISGSTTLTVKTPTPTLVAIEVTPTNPTIPKGLAQQFTATGVYSDNSTHDLTAQVTWSSSDTAVAAISNAANSQGLATSTGVGQTTITAVSGAISGHTTLTVSRPTLKSIEVTPTNPTIAGGSTVQLTATGVYSDNTTQNLTSVVTWSSSNSNIASVSNAAGSQGLVSAAAGVNAQVTITATTQGISGNTQVTVTPPAVVLQSIVITPGTATIPPGGRQQFTATGVYSNGNRVPFTNQVTWSSSDPTVAAVSNAAGSKGLAQASPTGIQGTVTITATDPATGVAGVATLKVIPPPLVSIAVTPNPAVISVAGSGKQQFTAIGRYSDNSTHDITTSVTWSSSDSTVVAVSNAAGSQGLATGVGLGQATVSAALDGITGSASVTVNTLQGITLAPQTASISAGQTQQFTATGDYGGMATGDVTTQVTWSSSNPAVATVSNAAGSQGLATAVAQGTTTITASLAGFTATATLTVAPTLVSIAITPSNPTIQTNRNLNLTATGTYSDHSTQDVTSQVTWSSSNTNVAYFGGADGARPGTVFARAATGTSSITATLGNVTGSTTLTVVQFLISPIGFDLAIGATQQFTATVVQPNGTNQDVTSQATWASSDTTIATIGSTGVATAVASGDTTISVRYNNLYTTTSLMVGHGNLVAISVAPANATACYFGGTVAYSATGTYQDGTQVSNLVVTWTSSNTVAATIDPASGVATPNQNPPDVTTRTTTISGTIGGLTGNTTLTVASCIQ